MKKINLEINGQMVEVLAQKMAGQLWFHYNGETRVYVPESSQAQGSSDSKNVDPSRITAPMPGKIIKLIKVAGDSVSEGDTIVVMEAMKMEYNLKATQDMVVDKINCTEGETVGLGEVLVELREE